MKVLGYIVQFYDEDSVSPQGTGKRLFRTFEEAKAHALKLANQWYTTKYEPIEGPVEWSDVRQELVDQLHTGLLFRSSNILIWIELVYEI